VVVSTSLFVGRCNLILLMTALPLLAYVLQVLPHCRLLILMIVEVQAHRRLVVLVVGRRPYALSLVVLYPH
jgi:hypothetical protein